MAAVVALHAGTTAHVTPAIHVAQLVPVLLAATIPTLSVGPDAEIRGPGPHLVQPLVGAFMHGGHGRRIGARRTNRRERRQQGRADQDRHTRRPTLQDPLRVPVGRGRIRGLVHSDRFLAAGRDRRAGVCDVFMLQRSDDHDASAVLGPYEVRDRSTSVKAVEKRRCPGPRPGAACQVRVYR